jgi:alkanesulfonate monooxygenase SsuD/methylene tetrahydromethanopterin reductase-like flavin-dependent oxidoreductase (luciferase family)
MQAGYFTMPLHPPGSDLAESMQMDVDQIVALEKLGFVEAWLGEHLTSVWENVPAPDLLIAQLLALTSTIKLGTGVNCLPNHNPLMLAHRIAQLDQMARGRFYWGIGSGGFPGDLEMMDLDLKNFQQRGLTREILDEVLYLWGAPEPGLREGSRWRYKIPATDPELAVDIHMKPFQKPHPPIGVAGIGPKSDMLTLAGQRGWIPMSINVVTTPVLKAHWQTYSESAAAAGQPADRSIWRICRDVYVGDTPEQARRDVIDGVLGRDWTDYFIPVLTKTNTLMGPKIDPSMPDDAVTPEYLAENLWIVGDAAEVTAKLRKLNDDVGGFGTLLVIGHEWRPGDKWHRSMERLVNEVLPALP